MTGMPCTCRTRARARPPRPAPTTVTGVVIMLSERGLDCYSNKLASFGSTIQPWQNERMETKGQRAARRTSALSRELIVQAATEILDAEGETALTFRALTRHLSTGYGAIYHHVTDKSDLLASATA